MVKSENPVKPVQVLFRFVILPRSSVGKDFGNDFVSLPWRGCGSEVFTGVTRYVSVSSPREKMSSNPSVRANNHNPAQCLIAYSYKKYPSMLLLLYASIIELFFSRHETQDGPYTLEFRIVDARRQLKHGSRVLRVAPLTSASAGFWVLKKWY